MFLSVSAYVEPYGQIFTLMVDRAGCLLHAVRPGSEHKVKVTIVMAAHLAWKPVDFTVVSGRGGYCKLVEGVIQ